jgi:hypothetical protein
MKGELHGRARMKEKEMRFRAIINGSVKLGMKVCTLHACVVSGGGKIRIFTFYYFPVKIAHCLIRLTSFFSLYATDSSMRVELKKRRL